MGIFGSLFGGPLSKDKFARAIMDGIRRAGETVTIHYDPDEFTLSHEDRGILNLGNAYADYLSVAKEDRKTTIQHWVRTWFSYQKEMPQDWEDVRPDLYPAVRARAYFELNLLRFEVEQREMKPVWPYQPIAEHLGVALVYDMGEQMRMIDQADLDGWGLTFYEAMEVAKQNLAELEQPFMGPEEGDGVYVSASRDNYDATRLLLLDLIRQFRVKGAPVAMVPIRDSLIVTGSADLEGLRAMLALVEEEVERPGPVSTIPVRLDGDDWLPWLPPSDHPLHNEFKLMVIQMLTEDYGEQKDLLEKHHEQTGEDVFVATYSAIQNEQTGNIRTYCTWVDGITDAWMPQTDLVAFVRDDEEDPRMLPWDRVVQAAGDLMQPLDMYPLRYRTTRFPSPQQLAAMGDEADF